MSEIYDTTYCLHQFSFKNIFFFSFMYVYNFKTYKDMIISISLYMSHDMIFPTMCDQQSLRSACAYAQSDLRLW